MRGGQYQLLLLYDTLADRGWEQSLLAGQGIQGKRDAERASWRSVRRLARECDVLHAHDGRGHTLAVMHGMGRPVVVARRVAFPIQGGPASRWKYRHAAHYIAISEYVASVLRSGGVPGEKITVVYDAAPKVGEARYPSNPSGPAETGFEGGLRIVSPNLEDPLKCRDLAVAACNHAGVSLRLSDDLRQDLRSADAFLYLSRSEGLGSALLLAMTLRVPVIASAVGGIPEVVSDRSTGLLVDNDIKSVSSAIARFQGDRAMRQRLADAALERVQAEFSCERMAERTAQVYRRVLEEACDGSRRG